VESFVSNCFEFRIPRHRRFATRDATMPIHRPCRHRTRWFLRYRKRNFFPERTPEREFDDVARFGAAISSVLRLRSRAILTRSRANASTDRTDYRCDLAISTRDAGRCTAVVVHATSKMTHTRTRPRARAGFHAPAASALFDASTGRRAYVDARYYAHNYTRIPLTAVSHPLGVPPR